MRLTRDGHLVCVHDRRLDRTSSGAGLVSTMTLAELSELEYGAWHDSWRPDGAHGDTSLLTLDALVSLVLDWHRPVKMFIETKHPVRYGSLVESKLLALLHRFGIASPASADRSRAVVMSFSSAAVWRIRRAAPLLPTVLLGRHRPLPDQQRGHAPSGPPPSGLRWRPCRNIRSWSTAPSPRAGRCTAGPSTSTTTSTSAGISGWRGSPRNHPGRTKAWLQNARTDEGTASSPKSSYAGRGGTGASEASASNSCRAASWFHTTTEPASLSVNSPIGTVMR